MKIFTQDYIEKFFKEIYKSDRNIEDCFQNINSAINLLDEKLHIGVVKVRQYEIENPLSKIKDENDRGQRCKTMVLYPLTDGVLTEAEEDEDLANPDCFVKEYVNQISLKTEMLIYPKKGYTWDEYSFNDVELISNAVYTKYINAVTQSGIARNAVTDIPTGIPNLMGLMKYADKLIDDGVIGEYDGFYFNVRNFKYVNNVFSYNEGHEVMKIYANTIKNMVGNNGNVCRLGGDNFVVILKKFVTPNFLVRIQDVHISYSNETISKEFVFGATVGAAHLDGCKIPDEIMLRVSVAFQASKDDPKRDTFFFSNEILKSVMKEKEILADFDKAMNNKEFEVYFQPKVDVNTRKLVGAESLVRWNYNGRIIMPEKFITAFEKSGHIRRLSFYMLESVCETFCKWKKEGRNMVRISVNFSKSNLYNQYLVRDIVNILNKHDIDRKYIEIEFTESENYEDYEVMSEVIAQLHGAGISASIDDFGKGYSSLNMLKKTGFDRLKIDKAFVPLQGDYPGKSKDILVFESIVKLARDLDMETVTEGVENESQLEYLKNAGCNIVQGYVFDKPLKLEDFEKRMDIGGY
ncbi:MAG: bifunctional diguanylate cyclase/phosphodiesterase [Eubacteriales bacterium]|nr:bifunctional diguanylate cyclase/phosphodiesterase [Eubacteriales bacterium]